MRVLTLFDLWLNLGLTRGILVILVEKGTSVTLVTEQVMPHHFGCSLWPYGKKMIFLDFSRSGVQIKSEQNTVSTLVECSLNMGLVQLSMAHCSHVLFIYHVQLFILGTSPFSL